MVKEQATINRAQPSYPAFIRYPRPGGRDPLTGLSRTQLFLFVKSGIVRSVAIKQPGCKRGVRLIDVPSLLAAINNSSNGS